MPRRREVPKREVLPDPKFGDQQVSKFINMIMRNGKKSVAERIVYNALDRGPEVAYLPWFWWPIITVIRPFAVPFHCPIRSRFSWNLDSPMAGSKG